MTIPIILVIIIFVIISIITTTTTIIIRAGRSPACPEVFPHEEERRGGETLIGA